MLEWIFCYLRGRSEIDERGAVQSASKIRFLGANQLPFIFSGYFFLAYRRTSPTLPIRSVVKMTLPEPRQEAASRQKEADGLK